MFLTSFARQALDNLLLLLFLFFCKLPTQVFVVVGTVTMVTVVNTPDARAILV